MSPLVFPSVLWSTLKLIIPFLCKVQSHIPLNSDTFADVYVSLWGGQGLQAQSSPKLALCRETASMFPGTLCSSTAPVFRCYGSFPLSQICLEGKKWPFVEWINNSNNVVSLLLNTFLPFELLYGPPTLLLMNLSNLWPAGNSLRPKTVSSGLGSPGLP